MFTEQISTLGAILRQQGLDEETAAAFEQLLGSCSQTLSHRGTVNLPGAQFIQVPPAGQRADYTLVNLNAPTVTVEHELTVEGDTVFEGDVTHEGDVIFEGDIIIGDDPPLAPATLCLLGCGEWDDEGCYNAPEYTITFPFGATAVQKRIVRLEGCTQGQSSVPPPIDLSSVPPPPGSSVEPFTGDALTAVTGMQPTVANRACDAFLTGTAPAALLLDPNSILAVDGGCTDCTDLNHYSFPVDWVAGASGTCTYVSSWFSFCGRTVAFRVVVGLDGGRVLMAVYLTDDGSTTEGNMLWAADLGAGPIDGSTLDVLLPFVSDPSVTPVCDASGSSMRVRADA